MNLSHCIFESKWFMAGVYTNRLSQFSSKIVCVYQICVWHWRNRIGGSNVDILPRNIIADTSAYIMCIYCYDVFFFNIYRCIERESERERERERVLGVGTYDLEWDHLPTEKSTHIAYCRIN